MVRAICHPVRSKDNGTRGIKRDSIFAITSGNRDRAGSNSLNPAVVVREPGEIMLARYLNHDVRVKRRSDAGKPRNNDRPPLDGFFLHKPAIPSGLPEHLCSASSDSIRVASSACKSAKSHVATAAQLTSVWSRLIVQPVRPHRISAVFITCSVSVMHADEICELHAGLYPQAGQQVINIILISRLF